MSNFDDTRLQGQTMNYKRIFTSLIAIATPFVLMWLGGGDFERGSPLATAAYAGFSVGGLVYFLPVWDKP